MDDDGLEHFPVIGGPLDGHCYHTYGEPISGGRIDCRDELGNTGCYRPGVLRFNPDPWTTGGVVMFWHPADCMCALPRARCRILLD